jgi:hypothetical protein
MFEPDQRERALGSMTDSLPATVWRGKAVWRPLIILGCGAKEVPPCHGARWRRAILDTMTVQDLRLEIGRDGSTKAGIPAELKRRVRDSGGELN